MSQSCSAQCPFLRQVKFFFLFFFRLIGNVSRRRTWNKFVAHASVVWLWCWFLLKHGCLTGVLDVNPNLPTSLQQGLFDVKAQGKSQFEGGIEQVARLFKASTVLLRFSNGKGNGFTPGYAVADDSSLDVRGFALKVFGVKGAKGHDATAETQDFIAITSETLFMEEMDNALPFFQGFVFVMIIQLFFNFFLLQKVSEKNSSVAYYGFLALHPILAARLIKFAKSGHVTELQQVQKTCKNDVISSLN